MILSLIKMTAAPVSRQALLEALRYVESQTRMKQGCAECAVYEARDQSRTILYVEQWKSREDLDRHIRSDLYRRILATMELASKRPEISFHEVSETRSIELIEGLRT